MRMIKPLQQGAQLLRDIRSTADRADGLRLWWLGQSGFLIQWARRHCLLDPYLSDSLTIKYADTDKPHERMSELVIAPEHLDMVDVVTSSHNHTDHLDAYTLGPLRGANPDLSLIIPEANRAFVQDRLQCDIRWPVGLTDGTQVGEKGFTFIGIPASHEDLDTDSQGRHRYMGYVIRSGRWTVYHSGDTLLYDGMVERLRPLNIDVALLPINGRDPARRVAGNLDGPQAAKLARDMGARMVIPCHYDMFAFNTAPPDAFAHACVALGQPFRVLRLGERLALPASGP